MTIAAGFWVHNGVLLCSDTMYTGAMKIHQEKIFPGTVSGKGACSCAFVLAGHEGFGKMAIQDCMDAIHDIPGENRNFRTVKAALRTTIKAINDEYVDTRQPPERDAARFELLVAFWLASDEKLRLFSTQGPALIPVKFYECLGTGSYLGHYLIRPAYHFRMNVEHAVLLATQALAAAKRYDANCGGGSVFLLLSDDGSQTPLIRYDVSVAESHIVTAEELARSFVLNIGNTRITDEVFEKNCQGIMQVAKTLRAQWKGKSDAWEKVVNDLRPTGPEPDSSQ
jgi:hypothetical protein